MRTRIYSCTTSGPDHAATMQQSAPAVAHTTFFCPAPVGAAAMAPADMAALVVEAQRRGLCRELFLHGVGVPTRRAVERTRRELLLCVHSDKNAAAGGDVGVFTEASRIIIDTAAALLHDLAAHPATPPCVPHVCTPPPARPQSAGPGLAGSPVHVCTPPPSPAWAPPRRPGDAARRVYTRAAPYTSVSACVQTSPFYALFGRTGLAT